MDYRGHCCYFAKNQSYTIYRIVSHFAWMDYFYPSLQVALEVRLYLLPAFISRREMNLGFWHVVVEGSLRFLSRSSLRIARTNRLLPFGTVGYSGFPAYSQICFPALLPDETLARFHPLYSSERAFVIFESAYRTLRSKIYKRVRAFI